MSTVKQPGYTNRIDLPAFTLDDVEWFVLRCRHHKLPDAVVVRPGLPRAKYPGDALASVSAIYTDLATGEPMELEDSMSQDGMSISRDAEHKPGMTVAELEAFVARCRDAGISGDAVVKARPKGLRQYVARVWVNSADVVATPAAE